MTVIQAIRAPFYLIWSRLKNGEKKEKLGALKGVFLPNILQMIGVILFMRLGWITGHIGLPKMLLIISMSSSILMITAFSMTSIVTNMKMGSGGSYFIISRSLGIEFGSAIGVLTSLSQITSIALNVSGFSYSLHTLFLPHISLTLIEAAVLCVLVTISYISTNLALRFQVVIFLILLLSFGTIFFGGTHLEYLPPTPDAFATMGFWVAFSMFFPATTGIESGMSMSGDLEKPSRALPIGTIGSVLTAFILYVSMACFLSFHVPAKYLISDPLILTKVAKVGFFVILGIWGATLSSAIGSILGAPRTIQAVADDGIYPRFLSKGYGDANEPRIATIFAFSIAMVITIYTNINQLIPILTMVCLVSYGLINFVSFFESLVENPSWRPSFRTPWYLSLIGAISCFMAMFMINAGASFIVLFMLMLLYLWSSKRKMQGNWEDLRYSLLTVIIRNTTAMLSNIRKNAKSWRPNILAIVDPELVEENLFHFANTIDQSKGFLTFGATIPLKEDRSHTLKLTEGKFREFFKQKDIPCFVHINPFDDLFLGTLGIVKNYGIGELRPNVIMLRHHHEQSSPENFAKFLLSSFHVGKNVVILKDHCISGLRTFTQGIAHKKIDLWWGGQYNPNFEFSLVLSQILYKSRLWNQANIEVKTLVNSEKDRAIMKERFRRYQTVLRMNNLSFQPIVDQERPYLNRIAHYSKDAQLVFIGLRSPKPHEAFTDYAKYYLSVVEATNGIPNVAYVLAGEEIHFEKIFL